MRKKGDLSDFECGMVVGARRAGLSISKTANLLGFSCTTISRVYREWSKKEKISSERQLCGRKYLVDVRGKRRMGRLVRDDRKATVSQINTRYNQGMQNTISEHTTHRTLKQMGYSSRRPHRVLLLSAKNRKRRLQFAQAHQHWTIEDWKNVAWSDESRFLLQHSDGMVRVLHKEHESMDPSCLVSTVEAGGCGVMVWGIFSWHTLGPLVPIEHRLNVTDMPQMLSCQNGPKSLRNVSNTLLNLCHKELRQFWRQKVRMIYYFSTYYWDRKRTDDLKWRGEQNQDTTPDSNPHFSPQINVSDH